MIIKDFKPFVGQHCETTATGCLLNQLGIELSEPMLFGLGEGLGFIFWRMKTMDFPFIGGRVKPDTLTKNICRNLNLELKVSETSSIKRAWTNVSKEINVGKAVGLKLDCYHLEYFTNKIHFAGHYAAIYGYDETHAFLVDTEQQGGKVTSLLENLSLARNEKGPMASKNLSYIIEPPSSEIDLKNAIETAIKNNAETYLNPPIKNLTYKGILKASKEIVNWFNTSEDVQGDFQTTAILMERAGTGGSLFRNLYRDFLKESADLLSSEIIHNCHLEFSEIAKQWKKVSELFHEAGATKDISFINEAASLMVEISESEQTTMMRLRNALN